MPRPHRLVTQLTAVTHLANRAVSEVGDALAVLAGKRAAVDGYPSGSGGIRGGGSSTAVESAMMRREHLDDLERMMTLHVMFIAEHLGQLLAEAGAIVGRPTATGTDRCNGGSGLPGAIEWGDATCERLAAVYQRTDGGWATRDDGLCDACRMRRHRWRKGDEPAA